MNKAAFTVAEFCATCGVGRSFAYTENAAGRLPFRKAGRRTLILKEDAERWLENLPTHNVIHQR